MTTVDGENGQRRCDRDQVAAAQATRDDRAATGVTDGEFPGENRRIDQRRAAHEDRKNLVAVFLKNFFFHRDEERQRRAKIGV